MHSNSSILTAHGLSTANIEHPEAEIRVLSTSQRQGDVLVLKVTTVHGGEPLGKGVTVVRAETNTANTHSLHGEGMWEPNPAADTDLVQGWLTVPDDGEAFLIHTEEHSALGIGAGTYEV
ncbi:MAG TPA: hypothetical protein VFH56_14490, partial [Acidimicrobiales bacterium]|nr:hypothetical protein [Acidimicrobiales bacterium]